MAGRRPRRSRWPILATAAVLAAGAVGASLVSLRGSAQRRDDRAAYVAYEKAVLVPIKDGGRVVQLQMKPALGELNDGKLSASDALGRAASWRLVLLQVRASILALEPPRFLGGIEDRWARAMDGYLMISDFFARAARTEGAERSRLLDDAAKAGTAADNLFDRAAELMQLHRRRLGLGGTTDLPDPAASKA